MEPMSISVATMNLPALYADGWRLITIAGRVAYLERPLPTPSERRPPVAPSP